MSSFYEAVTILAQTPAPAAPGAQGNPLMSMLPLVLMMVGFWFLVIAPQRKKQKELAKAIEALKSGDEVLIAGGIYGEIAMKKDDRFVVKIAEGTRIEVRKDAVQAVLTPAAATAKK